MKVGIVIQARSNSSRCPFKVQKIIAGKPMLFHQIMRLKNNLDLPIILATTERVEDNLLIEIAKECGIEYFRGSEDNVLKRFVDVIQTFNFDLIVRVTGDDPLIDPVCITTLLKAYEENQVNYLTTHHRKGWIYGTSAEMYESKALIQALSETKDQVDLEHVSPYIKKSEKFTKLKVQPLDENEILPDIYLTVDYPEDFEVVKQIIEVLDSKGRLYEFTQKELIEVYQSPEISKTNIHLHEGFEN